MEMNIVRDIRLMVHNLNIYLSVSVKDSYQKAFNFCKWRVTVIAIYFGDILILFRFNYCAISSWSSQW